MNTKIDGMPDFEALIRESADGDAQAFRRIFDHLQNKVFHYVLSRIPSREDALDLTQDIFVDLWSALKRFTYRSDSQFYGFVFLVARRKLARFYRSRKQTIELNEQTISASYECAYEDYRQLMRWIDEIKPVYQELLKFRYWSGLSFAEIAATMKIKETTAKVWHHRAINHLKKISSDKKI